MVGSHSLVGRACGGLGVMRQMRYQQGDEFVERFLLIRRPIPVARALRPQPRIAVSDPAAIHVLVPVLPAASGPGEPVDVEVLLREMQLHEVCIIP